MCTLCLTGRMRFRWKKRRSRMCTGRAAQPFGNMGLNTQGLWTGERAEMKRLEPPPELQTPPSAGCLLQQKDASGFAILFLLLTFCPSRSSAPLQPGPAYRSNAVFRRLLSCISTQPRYFVRSSFPGASLRSALEPVVPLTTSLWTLRPLRPG